ncbi:MAG: DUF3667 domain-containing protein [Gammaproteobacteria bacterium]|nr:DUF3667 domain-containing protein [Gammaproteobacteria bacterium]
MTTLEQQPSNDTKCDNCGEELLGAFCWVCGQKDSHYNRSVFKVIGDFFKEMFDVDSRVFTTLSTLFFRPGTLSVQFRDNKRASYVTPIRLYLFSSLVFFFLFAITTRSQNIGEERSSEGNEASQAEISLTQHDKPPDRSQEEIDEYLTSIRSLVRAEEGAFESAKSVLMGRIVTLESDPWSERIFEITDYLQDLVSHGVSDWGLIEEIQQAEEAHRRLRVLNELFQDDPGTRTLGEAIVRSREQGELLNMVKIMLSWIDDQYGDEGFREVSGFEKRVLGGLINAAHNVPEFVDDVTENLPLMMFVLLPIFVSILSLLSLGKGIRVVFQLIFAMHIHALAFITLTVEILLSLIFSIIPVVSNIPYVIEIIILLLFLFILVHIYLSFKKFYGSGHFVSLMKFFVLTLVYGLVLAISLLALAIFVLL